MLVKDSAFIMDKPDMCIEPCIIPVLLGVSSSISGATWFPKQEGLRAAYSWTRKARACLFAKLKVAVHREGTSKKRTIFL